MKSIIIVSLCVFLVPNWAVINNSNFQDFKIAFSKNYKSATEEANRAKIFEENVRKIEEHNKLFEGNIVTYEKGVNQFSDWTNEEVEAFFPKTTNILLSHTDNLAEAPRPRASVPTSVDWRTKNVLTGVKDQKTCRAYWAFSATGALESAYAINYGKVITLSEQNLIDCTIGEYKNYGCGKKGHAANSMLYVRDNGINSEENYPYTDKQGSCSFNSSDSILTISSVMRVHDDEMDLESHVALKPISVAIEATENLRSYTKGIFYDASCTGLGNSLNHEVLFVGYGEENGVQYWIAKNSWGTAWGESGYFRIIKGKRNCGITILATYPSGVTRVSSSLPSTVTPDSSSTKAVLSLSLLIVSLILLSKIN